MKKILWIGDLHVTQKDDESLQRLFARILDMQSSHDAVILAGDIYNDHGVSHARVQETIMDFFSKLAPPNSQHRDVFNIEGNHDKTSDGAHSSLTVHLSQNVSQILEAYGASTIGDGIALVPYYRDDAHFVAAVQKMAAKGAKIIFCHQEFKGAMYSASVKSESGVDPSLFADLTFICGHFHNSHVAKDSMPRIVYPGTPRWLTKSDANQDKGLWSFTIENGILLNVEFKSSADIVPAYWDFNANDSFEMPHRVKKDDKVYINYSGDSESDFLSKYSNYKIILRSDKKDLAPEEKVVSESKGIVNSISDYIDQGTFRTEKPVLLQEILRRVGQ